MPTAQKTILDLNKLKAENITKTYGGIEAVKDVSVEIAEGEVVGLLGPNGAGKTTTFYCIVGLIKPDSGRILLGENDITNDPTYIRARKGISYLPQEPSIFRKLTVEENLTAILEMHNIPKPKIKQKVDYLLEVLGIEHLRKSRASTLSGGERRRAEIARALTIDPKFLLLDEPFAGIDPIAVYELQGLIRDLKQLGIGILITDHNVRETLRIIDRAYIIGSGKIIALGSPQDVVNEKSVRSLYLGEKFQL